MGIINFLKSEWKFLAGFVTILVTISGWCINNQMNIARDELNKLREIRLQYLIQTYRSLALAVQRKPEAGSKYFRDMESAITDIQLFGTDKQIKGVEEFLKEFKEKSKGNVDSILKDLRNELRKELRLSNVKGDVQWFRPEGGIEQ